MQVKALQEVMVDGTRPYPNVTVGSVDRPILPSDQLAVEGINLRKGRKVKAFLTGKNRYLAVQAKVSGWELAVRFVPESFRYHAAKTLEHKVGPEAYQKGFWYPAPTGQRKWREVLLDCAIEGIKYKARFLPRLAPSGGSNSMSRALPAPRAVIVADSLWAYVWRDKELYQETCYFIEGLESGEQILLSGLLSQQDDYAPGTAEWGLVDRVRRRLCNCVLVE